MTREPHPLTILEKLIAAEVEIERLRSKQHDILVGRDRIEMELRAEIEQLRAALIEYANGDNWLREARFDANSHRFDGISFAEAALERKP